MSRIVVFTNLTLDGVMQAPGSADEDRRGGFAHGGWAAPYGAMQEAGEVLGETGALLFGRRTYENFYDTWHGRTDNPFSALLDGWTKYVASSSLTEPLPWVNSRLLDTVDGDASAAIAALRRAEGANLLVFGSGVLVESLLERGLIDDLVLLTHPLILGSGRKLFREGSAAARFSWIEGRTTAKGVTIAKYRPSA
jgi:dihydrofolate reductase